MRESDVFRLSAYFFFARMSVVWLRRALDLLLAHSPCDEHDLFCRAPPPTNHEIARALLIEHPSVVLTQTGFVWRPFVRVHDQRTLLDHLRAEYPRARRLVDLHGLYPHVEDDVRALVFDGVCTMLDPSTESIAALPPRTPASAALRELWAR